MHQTTQVLKTQMPISGSIIAPGGGVALSQQHQKQYPQQAQQLSTTMNQVGQSYQQSSAQVFFKKRASSNTNSQPQNVVSSPAKSDLPHQL